MKKRFFVIPIFCLFILMVYRQIFLVRRTVFLGKNFYGGILNNRTDNLKQDYNDLLKSVIPLRKTVAFFEKIFGSRLLSVFKREREVNLVDNILPLMPDVFAFDSQKTYFILLQNNMELRPTGGFMGSYVKVKFKNGGLVDFQTQDIYVPDGQILGHVEPPAPIQEAFKQGWFRLRDANWDPDFPQSAKIISWFFEKGGEELPDGIVAVNLSVVQKLLEITGPLTLLGYQEKVDKDNLYQTAQSYAETNFFPGSSQKSNVMSALGKAFFWKMKNLNYWELVKLFMTIRKNLDEKQILVFFNDSKVQSVFKELVWDGSMEKTIFTGEGIFNDYFFPVEANLGANKANLYIERTIVQEVNLSDKKVVKRVKINYYNQSQFPNPIKPMFWGGNYINFLRLYLPETSFLVKASINGIAVEKEDLYFEKKPKEHLLGVGFFVKTDNLSRSSVEVEYEIPKKEKISEYRLFFLKQPGIDKIPYEINLRGNNISCFEQKNTKSCLVKGQLVTDKEIIVKIRYN